MGTCCCKDEGLQPDSVLTTLNPLSDADETDSLCRTRYFSNLHPDMRMKVDSKSASDEHSFYIPMTTSNEAVVDPNFNVAKEGGEDDFNTQEVQQHDSDTLNNIEQKFDELSWVKLIPPPPAPEIFPYYVTAPVEEFHQKLFVAVFQLLVKEGLFFASEKGRTHPPFEYVPQSELRKHVDFTLPDAPVTQDNILDLIHSIIRYQPHVSHPHFMEQQIAGLEPYSCISDMIAACTNSNNILYILSTASTLLELELVRSVCCLVGYDLEQGSGTGTITPGSNLANGYAIRLAVRQKLALIKKSGLFGWKRPVFFVSERSLYIHCKSAILQGFGLESIISVDVLTNGQMNLEDLRAKVFQSISDGLIPCMIIATAGTSVVRAIDPLDKIADICQELGLWFHVDATYGGALLFSSTLKDRLAGVEKSDSMTWSQHFVLGVPCTSTCIVVPPRHRDKFSQYTGLGEGCGHGFMKTPMYDPKYDGSNNTILSSRRPDTFKFWLMWKAKGVQGIGMHVDLIFKNAQICLEEMRKREGFHPILDNFEGTNICFIYVPLLYRSIIQGTDEFREKTSKLCVALKQILVEKRILSLSYNELSPIRQTFLVLGLHSSVVTKQDIVFTLERIEYFAEVLTNPRQDLHINVRGGHSFKVPPP